MIINSVYLIRKREKREREIEIEIGAGGWVTSYGS